MIERGGCNMTGGGHLWDDHLKGQAFVASESLVLHFGISDIQSVAISNKRLED